MSRAQPFTRGGQKGWSHHQGHRHGFFHTYDALDVGGDFPARGVHVFLPHEAEDPDRRFPVLYLHDGDCVFWPGGAFGKTWSAAEVLDAERIAGRVAPVILVALHPTDRNAEYTHVDWAHGTRPHGRLPAFADWVADRVKGFVDRHYPTLPEARHTAVAGSSHGGLAAFWFATARPDRFGKAAALSPSFFSGLDSLVYGPGPDALGDAPLLRMAHSTLSDPARRPTLWISWGNRRDGGHHNAVVEALAARRGAEMVALLTGRYGYRARAFEGADPEVDLHTWVDPVGGHDEEAWSWQLRLVLRAFFPG